MRFVCCSIIFFSAGFARAGVPDRLVTIKPGGLPIILSAPHGGRTAVPDVPERKGGERIEEFKTVRDDNTFELAEMIAVELEKRLKARPYLVLAQFERKYIDANRPEKTAFESDKAKTYYRAYHQGLEDYTKEVQKKWKRGLLLDIHGQNGRPDTLVRGTNDLQTVELLLKRHGRAALIGSRSIFGAFAGAGFKVYPELDSEDLEDKRYNGGHTVRTYGSHQGSGIDAIQLEFGSEMRQKSRLAQTAAAMAEAIAIFYRDYLK